MEETRQNPTEETLSYYTKRVTQELGITEEENKIELYCEVLEGVEALRDRKIFEEDEKGNIKILVYDLERHPVQYELQKSTNMINQAYRGDTTQDYYITRLHPDNVKDGNKYLMPKGVGTYPFLPPQLIEKYDKAEAIETLVLTEGYFKAFKGAKHGLDIVGLSSITHYRSKKTKSLHSDILSIIYRCKVKNVVMLYDGDCLNISTKDIESGKDLARRPNGFLQSMLNIKELLQDTECVVWFAHVLSECHAESPKGLDDLLCTFRGKEAEVLKGLTTFGGGNPYFSKLNLKLKARYLQSYFSLKDVEQFYAQWIDQIGAQKFTFYGTEYQFVDGSIKMLVPKEAKGFFRVGDDYYEMIDVPNIMQGVDRMPIRRQKGTIKDDFGGKIFQSIPKYKAFCNVPDHLNYQQVINNCYNQYSKFTWDPEPGDWSYTKDFLDHIFGDQIELGLDYVQLLYQRPSQILPILCLVSKENSTGKTTFANWLKEIFQDNMRVVGNAELSNEFNAYIATKLIVACDETFIEKRAVVEKIKAMSTSKRVAVQAKGKDHVEMWHFAKYLLLSNNEDNFILANDEDIRYWVRKINRPTKDVPDLLNVMREEIPAFLAYLNERKISTPNTSRMWFEPSLLVTDALRKVREGSRSKIEKSIEGWIRDQFVDFGIEEVKVTPKDLKDILDINNSDALKIGQILSDKFKGVPTKTTSRYSIWKYMDNVMDDSLTKVEDKRIGKPYTIARSTFFTEAEIAELWGDNKSN